MRQELVEAYHEIWRRAERYGADVMYAEGPSLSGSFCQSFPRITVYRRGAVYGPGSRLPSPDGSTDPLREFFVLAHEQGHQTSYLEDPMRFHEESRVRTECDVTRWYMVVEEEERAWRYALRSMGPLEPDEHEVFREFSTASIRTYTDFAERRRRMELNWARIEVLTLDAVLSGKQEEIA